MANITSTGARGGTARALKILFKGAKTAKQKSLALKRFKASKSVQSAIFKKAGLTGAAKVSSIIPGGALLGATLAGATAIRKSGKKLTRIRKAGIKSYNKLSELQDRRRKQIIANRKKRKNIRKK